MDYRDWIEHVRAFSEGLLKLPGTIHCTIEIDPPLDRAEVAALEAMWPTGVPGALVELWTRGSGRVHCPYVWYPPQAELPRLHEIVGSRDLYGGVRFLPAHEIFPGNSGADPADDSMRETLGSRDLALWCRCAIFLYVENGDALSLDPARNPADPAVVYLVHDEPASEYLSPSFSQFLRDWTTLSFIGPEIWLLEPWIDRERGGIDTTRHKTDELRKLLG